MNTPSDSSSLPNAPEVRPKDPPTVSSEPVPAVKPEAPKRLDPTRYGDWEKNGRCIDF